MRKTSQGTLTPPPELAPALGVGRRRCRDLYNAGLEERTAAWEKGGVSSTLASQRAHLPAIKQVRPEDPALHSQVLQDVLTRLDRAYQAFVRRVAAGHLPGSPPRGQGATRYARVTSQPFGTGAHLANGFLVLAKRGRLALRWSRPSTGVITPVPSSRQAAGWYVCFSWAEVALPPWPLTGGEPGVAGGRKGGFSGPVARGLSRRVTPARPSHPLQNAQQRLSRTQPGRQRRTKAQRLLAKKPQPVRRQRPAVAHQVAR